MDEKAAADVAHQVVPPSDLGDEPMAWQCGWRCWDSTQGERGAAILWTPPNLNCSSPRILFVHGGSWLYCAPASCGYPALASKIAALSDAVVLAIDYPLVPYGNYSSIQAHSERALRWLATHGPHGDKCDQADPLLIVGGDSSGGGSAASLSLRAAAEWREKRRASSLPPVSGTILFSPWLNMRCDSPSYYHHAYNSKHTKGGMVHTGDILFRDDPTDNTKSFQQNALQYLADSSLVADPVASPYFAGPGQFDSSMHFHISVSGTESITSDSTHFADTAAASGATVYLNLYPGMWHDFMMYAEGCGSGQQLPQAVKALESVGTFVRTRAAQVRAALHVPLFLAASRSGPGVVITSVFYSDGFAGTEHPPTELDPRFVPMRVPPGSPQPWGWPRDALLLFAGILLGCSLRHCSLTGLDFDSWRPRYTRLPPEPSSGSPVQMDDFAAPTNEGGCGGYGAIK